MKPKFRYLSGLAAIALVAPATADVIYSNLKDIAIPATYDGVYLNVETGAWSDDMFSPVAGWDINPYFGGSVLWNSPSFQPVRSGTGELNSVLNLGSGIIVNGSSVYSTFVQGLSGDNPGGPGYGGSETHLGAGPGQFTAGNEGYLGFRLNGTGYGWMRVVFTNNNTGALIKDWAYDTSAGSIATGNVVQNGNTFTLNSAFGSFTLGSQITGANDVIKNGANTVTVTGDNSYSGTTAVSLGTLALAAGASLSDTSSVNIGASATLTGVGTISGTTTIEGNHSPGNSPGIQTFTSGLAYSSTATLNAEFVGDTLGLRGTDFDGVNVTGGDLSIHSLATLALYTSSVDYTAEAWDSARVFTVIDHSGAGTSTGSFVLNTTNAGSFASQGSWALANTSNDIVLSWTPVPEPRAALLGGLGLLLLFRRRR